MQIIIPFWVIGQSQPEDQVVTIYEGIKALGNKLGHQVDFYDRMKIFAP